VNDEQSAKLFKLELIGWSFQPIVFRHETTKAFIATNDQLEARMYLAVREDGSHKFYRNLTTPEEG
jgi:hypothetical protein